MFFGLFGASEDVVGIDIGTRSVKLVQLKRVKGKYQLVNLGIAQLPTNAIVDNAIMDSAAVADCVRSLVESHSVQTKNVATSVSGHSVIIRNIFLPMMSEDEVEASIEWEAEQYIPFEISDVNLDFQILGPDPRDPSQIKVLLVAAKKDFIDEYLSVFNECGLNPVVMDIDCFALENAFQANYEQEEDVVGLIDVGSSSMNINVLHGGVSVFNRDIQVGGNMFNDEIQKRLGLNSEEAELIKLGGAIDEVPPDVVAEIISDSLEHLVQEIQRSIDFFAATSSDKKVDKVYLSGGVVKTHGLVETLQQKLGIPVEIMNPLRNVSIDSDKFDMEYVESVLPFLAIGAGLAMRRLGDK
jgi:type IV pilus assembly protein PilM